jgi:hypothetical protein
MDFRFISRGDYFHHYEIGYFSLRYEIEFVMGLANLYCYEVVFKK